MSFEFRVLSLEFRVEMNFATSFYLIKEPLAATTITFAKGKYITAKLYHIAKQYFTNPVRDLYHCGVAAQSCY